MDDRAEDSNTQISGDFSVQTLLINIIKFLEGYLNTEMFVCETVL